MWELLQYVFVCVGARLASSSEPSSPVVSGLNGHKLHKLQDI